MSFGIPHTHCSKICNNVSIKSWCTSKIHTQTVELVTHTLHTWHRSQFKHCIGDNIIRIHALYVIQQRHRSNTWTNPWIKCLNKHTVYPTHTLYVRQYSRLFNTHTVRPRELNTHTVQTFQNCGLRNSHRQPKHFPVHILFKPFPPINISNEWIASLCGLSITEHFRNICGLEFNCSNTHTSMSTDGRSHNSNQSWVIPLLDCCLSKKSFWTT